MHGAGLAPAALALPLPTAWPRSEARTHDSSGGLATIDRRESPGGVPSRPFHSDGSRSKNWTRRVVAGQWKRYDYPRWQFTNHSADIRELCCWALDLVDIPWRQSNRSVISVSTRTGVARLDELIG